MDRRLYYFNKDSGLKLDFRLRYRGKCVSVAVKAQDGNAKSVKAVLKHGVTLQHKKNVVSVFNTDGFGSNPKNRETELKERDETIAECFPPPMLTLIREHEKQRNRMNSFSFAVLALPRYMFRKMRRLLFKM